MKLKSISIFILIFAFIYVAFAAEIETGVKKQGTQKIMDQFLAQMTALKRYFVSEDQFLDPKNNLEISARLKDFAFLAKEATHDPQLQKTNFKFSSQILQAHISEIERVFRLGNKTYARWMLNSTTSVCMSCHAQVPVAHQLFDEFGSTKIYSSEFDQAEFLFALRSFDKAATIYDKLIRSYSQNQFKKNELERSLERLVTYYSRIKRDPVTAAAQFEDYKKLKEMPYFLKNNLNSWITQFKAWNKSEDLNPVSASEGEILKFAKNSLQSIRGDEELDASNPHIVTYLKASGFLYEYLQNHPKTKVTPEILYWLSLCERAISNNFFYSLADLYLRECITQYPEHTIAKKCFKEFEAETILGYTGSSGTHIPSEVKSDLEALRKLVESGGKLKLKER